MSIVTIVQARAESTRLPGKIFKSILGKPMLAHMLERVKRAQKINSVVLATTDKSEDDATAAIGERSGVTVFRGSESNVLDRFYRAASAARAETVVRLTGDCPLVDPAVLDEVVERYLAQNVDYTHTPVNYPEGLDTEVFSFSALERAHKEARLPSEREHVTPYIRNHPELFRLDEKWRNGKGNHSAMHWSVDTKQNFEFISRIFEKLFPRNEKFNKDDVLALLEREPELLAINKDGTGYEGYEKSKREDAIVGKLVLGTVELGMPYGLDKDIPQPSEDKSFEILDTAYKAGIETFDTASGYGSAEEVLGRWIKTRGLKGKVRVISKGAGRGDVEMSLKHLGLEVLDGYLLHNAKGSFEELQEARRAGLVEHIGASVYEPEEVQPEYEYVQAPLNALDRRFENLAGCTFFARSPFLQGLLLQDTAEVPPHLADARPYIEKFSDIARRFNLSRLQAALLFTLHAHPNARVVFGVKTMSQLKEILSAARVELPSSFIEAVRALSLAPKAIINPSVWNTRMQ